MTDATRVPDPGGNAGFLLWHATLRWQREIAAALTPVGLTHVQFVLLASTWWLNGRGEQPSQLALARHAGTDVKMTSQVVRTLERRGLLVREVDPDDTRARRLRTSDAGAELAPRAMALVDEVDTRFFAPGPAETAVGLLARLARVGEPPTG